MRVAVMRNSRKVKIIRRLIGAAILGAALWYLWGSFSQNIDTVTPLLSGKPVLWLAAAGLSCGYGLTLFMLAYSWALFLHIGDTSCRLRTLFYVYTVTSIGKYFPGGVLHFGGRQALGARFGLAQRQLLKASIAETIASAGAALLLGGLLFVARDHYFVLAVIVALSVCIVIAVANNNRYIKPVLAAVGFMAAMGAITIVSAWLLNLGAPPLRIAGAYLIAWCVGFLAPGVSAGIGVREAVLIYLLGGEVTPGEAAALAIMMRFITTIGDGVFFVSSPAFRPSQKVRQNKEHLTIPVVGSQSELRE